MLDTIVLTLPLNNFRILDHKRFSPSSEGLIQHPFYPLGKNGFYKCYQNPTKDDAINGTYKPRLTAIRRVTSIGYQTMLKIEFSIPKLLLGNNFDEVSNENFEEIINLLFNRLYEMGVHTTPDMLTKASVSGIHYSKNIALTDYSTPYSILKELYKTRMTKRLDVNQTDFRNGGHSLKWRTNDFELCFYDKIKDLEQSKTSEKRSIEKQNELQYDLFNSLHGRKAFEVLRMEVRLNTRKRIKTLFDKLQISTDYSFKSIFSEQKSKIILNHFLGELKTEYSLLSYQPSRYSELLLELRRSNHDISFIKALQIIGIKVCVDEIGNREMRNYSNTFGRRSWDSVMRSLNKYTLPTGDYSIFKPLEKILKDFIPLRIKKYSQNKP